MVFCLLNTGELLMLPTLPVIIGCGVAGGLFFTRLNLPGGAMVGAMAGVVLVNSLADLPPCDLPEYFKTAVYIALGIVMGCMYRPGMLAVVRQSWPTLLISTAVILLAGIGCAFYVCRSGVLGPTGAYLATSPGGLNVLAGLAAEMGEGGPIVVVYQLVRLYAILLIAPFVGKWLHSHL